MFDVRTGKALLVASAIAGLAFIVAPSQGNAASRGYCAAYAHQVANDYAPRRGLVGSALALPFDVTGAVLTGRTTYDARWERAYNVAYADCRASGPTAMVTPESRAFAVAPGAIEPEPQGGGSCDFSKYHGSWDPSQC